MTYYAMKECFDACGDDDMPYIENRFNSVCLNTKKHLLRNHHDYMASVDEMLSDKWQIKRAEPKVLSHNEIALRVASKLDNAIDYGYECAKAGDQNGQLREYYRPEQVELREAVSCFLDEWKFGETRGVLIKRLYSALDNLKPPKGM